jgi:hypothetical protein
VVLREVAVKGYTGLVKVGVIGFAVIAGGVAAYRYRDKLTSTWRSLKSIESIKGHAGKLSFDRISELVPPLKDLVGQYAHLR